MIHFVLERIRRVKVVPERDQLSQAENRLEQTRNEAAARRLLQANNESPRRLKQAE